MQVVFYGEFPAAFARSGSSHGIADFSSQSEQPVTKHLVVEVTGADAHT
jgi:hypothetical protein